MKTMQAVLQRQEAEDEEGVGEAEAEPVVVVTDEDRTEYGHLRRRTGRADNTGFDSVEDYVTYRDDHFGGRATYDAIRVIADAEWDDNAVIRRMVGQSTDSNDRKKALYRWLRLEYRGQGIDTEAAIVTLMRRGMTPELEAAVDRVRAAHPGLRTGGFVPRPKKHTDVGYRLGTLSEHGTGKAIDVRPQHDNPQIPRADWGVIEEITGRNVVRTLRRWQMQPNALWQDVHDLNAEYVAEVTTRMAAVRAARTAAGKDPDNPHPRNEVLAGSRWLRRRAAARGLSFFTLAEDLVLAMHAEDLRWGVTFGTPDLHHFEID